MSKTVSMLKWGLACIDVFLRKLPAGPFTLQVRTRFFVALLLLGQVLMALALVAEVVRGRWAFLPVELCLAAFLSLPLVLMYHGHHRVALDLYSLGLPIILLLRYATTVLSPGSNRDLLYSDYLLVYASLNLVLLTLA